MKKISILFAAIVLFISCQKEKVTGVISYKAMVVSARVEASEIGLQILKKVAQHSMQWWPPNWLWQLHIRILAI